MEGSSLSPRLRKTLRQEGFPFEFQTWLYRSITEGVNLGFREQPSDHQPPYRFRTDEERTLLAEQYRQECALGRTVQVGEAETYGPLFSSFHV